MQISRNQSQSHRIMQNVHVSRFCCHFWNEATTLKWIQNKIVYKLKSYLDCAVLGKVSLVRDISAGEIRFLIYLMNKLIAIYPRVSNFKIREFKKFSGNGHGHS